MYRFARLLDKICRGAVKENSLVNQTPLERERLVHEASTKMDFAQIRLLVALEREREGERER